MNHSPIMPGTEPFFFPGGRTGCLLIHGFTGSPFEMRELGEHLNQQGHTVLGVRLSAHGTQPEDMIRARWQDWLASVYDGWHLLAGCTDQIFVMGLSMGAMLTLLFASQTALAGIVVMAGPHHLPDDPRLRFIKPISMIKPFLAKGEPDWVDPTAEATHICYDVDPTRSYHEIVKLMEALQAGFPAVRAPILLIYSENDQSVLAEERHMELIYEAVASQHKETLWVQGSGHVVTRDAQRQMVFDACADFVARIAGAKQGEKE
jgi:carboxylesterase